MKKHTAYDEHGEPLPTQAEAISTALVLVQGQYNGNSDFDKGMRLLQKHLKIKTKKVKK